MFQFFLPHGFREYWGRGRGGEFLFKCHFKDFKFLFKCHFKDFMDPVGNVWGVGRASHFLKAQ